MSGTATSSQDAMSALVLGAVALDIRPKSTNTDDLTDWIESLAGNEKVQALAAQLQGLVGPTIENMNKMASGKQFLVEIDDVEFMDRSQRWRFKFIKRSQSGEVIKHERFGKGDSGSTERTDDRNKKVAANAEAIGQLAKANIGKIVRITKISEQTDRGNFSSIVGMELTDIEPVGR